MLQILKERRKAGLTQAQVSERTGIAPGDYSLIERGLRPVYPAWKARLARLFRKSALSLFSEVEDESQQDAPNVGNEAPSPCDLNAVKAK